MFFFMFYINLVYDNIFMYKEYNYIDIDYKVIVFIKSKLFVYLVFVCNLVFILMCLVYVMFVV